MASEELQLAWFKGRLKSERRGNGVRGGWKRKRKRGTDWFVKPRSSPEAKLHERAAFCSAVIAPSSLMRLQIRTHTHPASWVALRHTEATSRSEGTQKWEWRFQYFGHEAQNIYINVCVLLLVVCLPKRLRSPLQLIESEVISTTTSASVCGDNPWFGFLFLQKEKKTTKFSSAP